MAAQPRASNVPVYSVPRQVGMVRDQMWGGGVSRLTGLRLNRQYYRKPWSFLIAVECSEITKNLKEKYHFLKRQNIEKNILNKTN